MECCVGRGGGTSYGADERLYDHSPTLRGVRAGAVDSGMDQVIDVRLTGSSHVGRVAGLAAVRRAPATNAPLKSRPPDLRLDGGSRQ